MSDQINHECGIGLIRLFHPLSYYEHKYGSALWGLNKLYMLMEKQRNRGQDGAGIASLRLNMEPGTPYFRRKRNNQNSPWTQLFNSIHQQLLALRQAHPDREGEESAFLKQHFPWAGEILMGHLRYGTHGSNGVEACHPVSRISNWRNRSLMIAGNFNLTNTDRLFQNLIELGQHPRHRTDTETVLERIGHFLDRANETLYEEFRQEGYSDREIANLISDAISPKHILEKSAKIWDGGYVIGGIIGNGDVFVARDPSGIRPCYYYYNEEFFVAASERATISTVFNLPPHLIKELSPAHIVTVKSSTKAVHEELFIAPKKKSSCSFERIYFSRGSDVDIYRERKALGAHVTPQVLEAINYDLKNTVFSYIPNTAESAFWGMIKAVEDYLNEEKGKRIKALGDTITDDALSEILQLRPRVEKVVIKDVKMRTFIADDSSRDDLISHVYDVTQGVLEENVDTLVCLDDSIVRGNTLRKSILSIIIRLKPKRIVIVSSAPQIRYPDCYGIDMSQLSRLIAFQAAIALLKERGMESVIDEVYSEIIRLRHEGRMSEYNVVKKIYERFSEEEISDKITDLLRPDSFPCGLQIVYQPLSNLSKAMPEHTGAWYFSGDYPTLGGNRASNQSFLHFYEGKNMRAYQFMS